MVETELLQPIDVRLVGQQKADSSGLGEICELQSTLNVQLETARSTSMQPRTEAVTLGGLQNVRGMETPFWQLKGRELGPEDFDKLRIMLEAQRDKIHQQLQELQKVVVSQCRITGTNPLAQEMAAAVLEKGIGKRFGESLSPKALKCLYNVFSIKDTITKKEAREISARCGATVTQVREFFAGQRSRVRKVVQSSHIDQGSNNMLPKLQSADLNQSTIGLHCAEDTLSLSAQQVESRECNHLLLLDVFRGREDGILTKQYAVEKAEHLINVMHKEDTFTGHSQLAQVIMQAHESVLRCFMARGGLQLINKWLIQAAAEEQTSLIRVMLKTITRLPLGSALPRHMSLLLQTVNKLRFYRAQDIASRSRLLLSRWSRFFKSSQSGKIVSLAGLSRTTQLGQKRTRDSTQLRVIEDSCKKNVKADTLVDLEHSSDLVSSSLTEDKTLPQRDKPEVLTEINKTKKRLGSFLIQGDRAKEKRKVQLFEGSQIATRRKDVEVTRSSSFEPSSRPLSADDIKKAKRRAYFLGKAQKPSSSSLDESMALDSWSFSSEIEQRKLIKTTGSVGAVHNPSVGDNSFGSTIRLADGRPASKLRSNVNVSDVLEGQHADMPTLLSGEGSAMVAFLGQISECCKATKLEVTSGLGSAVSSSMKQSEVEVTDAMDMPSIPWTTPPRVVLDSRWKTASGEHSTEVVQETNRLRNEVEAIYISPQFIPSSPVEPAERLCLFVDDASVPEILLEAVEEESLEKDCSLQSPRDDSEKAIGEEADSEELIPNMDSEAQGDTLILGREGLNRPIALEMPLSTAQTLDPMITGDQQPSLLVESTEMNHMQRLSSATVDPTKNLYASPSDLTLGTALEQKHNESGISGYCNSEVYQQHRGVPFLQVENREAVSISREQHPLPTHKAPVNEPSTNNVRKEDIVSSNDNHREETTTSLAVNNREVPSFLNHITIAGAGNTSTAVDLSDLSKEDCMDMLNIVLQQLMDNAKASGADLELLSLFLKNPQLVYSLMSSHRGPSGKGSSSVSSGMHLTEVMPRSNVGDVNSQLQKLVGRDICAVPNTASLLEKVSPHSSQFGQPVRSSMPMPNPYPHSPLPPQSLQVVEQKIQLLHKEGKSSDGTQFLKDPLSKADVSFNSSDYDWTQPYDYPITSMQQGPGVARQLMHPSKVVDNGLSVSAYSQTPPGYGQSHFTRASHSKNPTVSLGQTDPRSHSSMLMYDGGHANMNATILHVERDERIVNRRNGFPVVDAPQACLLQTGSAISDGLLPVPDITSNNLRAHLSGVPHDTHPLHGGKVPPFVPELRGTNPAVGNHMPSYVSSGHNYCDQSFRPPSGLNVCPPVVPQPPPSFLMNSTSPLWRPPHSRSNLSRHARPGWREI